MTPSPLATDWTPFLHEKAILLQRLIPPVPNAILANFVTEVNVNNILSVNQMKVTSLIGAAKSQIMVCFSQFFSRRLLKFFRPRLPWENWSAWHQLVLLGVLNGEFVAGLSGLVAAGQTWSYFFQFSRMLSLPFLCFRRCKLWKLIFYKVVWWHVLGVVGALMSVLF